MQKLVLNLENCYGIKKMNHTLDFSQNNISVIYAPNGTMKTSFANTFKDLSNGKIPSDRVYGLTTVCDVKNESNNPIDVESILVISSFDESMTKDQGKLMVDSRLQGMYMELHKDLIDEKENLFKNVKEQLGYSARSKFDIEQSISSDFNKQVKEIYETLKAVKNLLESGTSKKFNVSDVNYSVLFDPKALVFYKKDSNSQLIKQYTDKYEELLEKSKFLSKGVFDHRNFSNVANNLKENGFFEANHQVVIKNKEGSEETQVVSEEALIKLLDAEKEAILNNGEIKRIFEKISTEINANKETKELNAELMKHPELIIELENIEEFKKKVWIEAFRDNLEFLNSLVVKYDETFEKLKEISLEAQQQETKWKKVLSVFKERFHVPFTIEASNQVDVILHNVLPTFEYKFIQKGENHKQIEEKSLIGILSTGEKRAYYLLNLIYEVEIRLNENKSTLLILDDIVDSFDYKNKYAIIEYLNDIKDMCDQDGNKLFSIIALTHNFDFYRTVGSRLANSNNCFISAEAESGIELTPSQYIKNYFSHVKKQCLANVDSFIITAIPFVRNLIEYTFTKEDAEYEDYVKLTNLLHVKRDSYTMKIGELQEIYNKYWLNGKGNFAASKVKETGEAFTVFEILNDDANRISNDPTMYNKVNIENKIVLSIAIRLKAEELMINQIKSFAPQGEEIITSIQSGTSQTGKLFKEYKKHLTLFANDYTKQLEKVVMMTPENIHINSFMYEPILDMQCIHLVDLYKELA
ncbi:MAG: hypothetical protein JJE17_08060 [Peptostreptococcaceae bacterium]|nr:hypothetical protein [Peptostreptococcaceae bacterium]